MEIKDSVDEKEYIKIKVKSYEKLIEDKDKFMLALQLARLSNALTFQMRMIDKVIGEPKNEDNLGRQKDLLELTLLLGSILFES